MERDASGRCGALLLSAALLLQLAARGATAVRLHAEGAAGGQLVVREGEALSLSCEDDADVRLSYPVAALYGAALPEVVHRRTGARWNATLLLRSAAPAHTGYYNCSSGARPADADSLYVYVRGAGQRPWVMDSEDMRQRNMVSQYSAHLHTTATLDCRPNDPNIHVQLRDKKNRTLTLGRQPDGSNLSWDPRTGFQLGPVEMSHSGTYWCVAENNPRVLQVTLQVVGVDLVAPSVWADPEAPYVARGSDVTIICELALVRRVDFNLTWSSPSGRVNEGSRWASYGVGNDSRAWHRRTKLLYVFAAKDADAGEYTCTAQDAAGNRRSASLRLQVGGAVGSESAPAAATPGSATRAADQGASAAGGAAHAAPASGAALAALLLALGTRLRSTC